MKRIIVPTMLALNCASAMAYSNLTQQQAEQRATQVSDVTYQLSLKLDRDMSTFTGSNQVTFNLQRTDSDVVLDFDGKLVSAVIINGKSTANFTFDQKDENIILPKNLLKKGQNTVSISFEAKFSHSGSGLHQFRDPKDNNEYFYSDFETANAHRMYPNFDQPSIKAVFILDVDAPMDWQLISNTLVAKSSQSNHRKHSYFKPTEKIPTYITHLSAGPYAMWEDNTGKYPMRLFARKSLAEFVDPQRMFETTHKGIAFFERYYGFDYPFGKYDQIFAPEFNAGAMENAGAVTFREAMIFREPPTKDDLTERDVTILHEMAHMWFGDLVTMQWWNDLWLNESFADFMGYQGLEGIGTENAWAQAAGRKQWAYMEDQLVTTHPILSDIPDLLAASANFDGITYAKGLAALRQLQYFIGPDVFRDGIRQYFQQYAFKNTTLKEFIGALEQAHGQKLTGWVDSWLGTKDVNTMQIAYEDKDGKIAGAKVRQTGGRQNDLLRDHANLVGLYYVENGKLVLRDKIRVTFGGEITALTALNGKKTPAVILPNIEDYDYVKIRFDSHSMQWFETNMALVQDTPTKTIIWRTLWDMVRDQELKASDYYAMVVKYVGDEQDVDVLAIMFKGMVSVIQNYTVDEKVKAQSKNEVFALAKAKVTSTKPESDLQRSWFDMLVKVAETDDQLNYLVELYDQKQVINGIDMNVERKWDILGQLAEANKKALINARMTALVALEPSARSKNKQLRIEASYPDVKVKAQVWDTLTQKSDYSLNEKRFIGGGLYNDNYPELAKPYISKYFAEIENLYRRGEGYPYAAYFIRRMFPKVGMEDTVVAAEQFIATSEVPKTYKTLVLKSLDELKRTLEVRKHNL